MLMAGSAAMADISPIVFRLEATNASGSGVLEIPFESMVYVPDQNMYTWVQSTPVYLTDGGQLIATLNNANLAISADPAIGMGFAVQAGTSDTTFVITSALLSFPQIPANLTEGRASAGFTVTDLTGNGAQMLGLGSPGTGMYRADYNGFVPGGTKFCDLVYSVVAGPGGSGGGSQNYPPSGYVDIPVGVYDMSVQIAFTLTANDLGSGTSYYQIIPEPMTAGLLLIGAMALARRR